MNATETYQAAHNGSKDMSKSELTQLLDSLSYADTNPPTSSSDVKIDTTGQRELWTITKHGGPFMDQVYWTAHVPHGNISKRTRLAAVAVVMDAADESRECDRRAATMIANA